METTSEGGTNAINATSKPRGTYLDPLKACALSGESGINIGKSESATYSKYMNIVRQTRRTASRVSVLNDVERSRLSSVMRRIDDERAYSTAVLDRQKRQFKQSLEGLDRHRSRLLGQIDVATITPAHLRAKQSQALTNRKRELQSVHREHDREEPVTSENTGTVAAVAAQPVISQYALRSRARKEKLMESTPDDCHGEKKPIFYTGLGPDTLQL